jgi:alpha-aminoadipate carrier protein LysW
MYRRGLPDAHTERESIAIIRQQERWIQADGNETRRRDMQVICPECGAEFAIPDDTMTSEIVVCPECGVELEVISVDPPELAVAPEVEEDWGE